MVVMHERSVTVYKSTNDILNSMTEAKELSPFVQIVGRVLNTLQSQDGPVHIEEHPDHLSEALQLALALVSTVKCYVPSDATHLQV